MLHALLFGAIKELAAIVIDLIVIDKINNNCKYYIFFYYLSMTKDTYLIKRKNYAKKLDNLEFFKIIDNWPLHVGIKNLKRFLVIYDLLLSVKNLDGDIAELGSWEGANLLFLAKLSKILNLNKKVYCFDWFKGVVDFSDQDGDAKENKFGTYKGNKDIIDKSIELYELENIIQFELGDIVKTVPNFMNKFPDKKFSFLYYDADVYLPCKVMLENLSNNLVVGGLILFDEYNDPEWPGETKAVNEFLEKNNSFEVITPSISEKPSLVIKRVK